MPEEPEIPHRPVSRPPTRPGEFIEEQDEQDLWDLEEMPAAPAAESPVEPVERPAPTVAAEPVVPAMPAAPPPEAATTGQPVDEAPIEPAGEPVEAPTAAPLAGRDRGVIAITAGVLLAISVAALFLLFSGVSTEPTGLATPDFPVEGDHAKVEQAASYWREPVRDGEQRDVARPEVEFLPAVEITLAGGDGALRAIFRDQHDAFIGDPITRSFSGGRFADSDGATLEFAATDGFHGQGQYHSYRVGDEPWHVEFLEASSANAPGSEFRTLFRMPLSSNRR